MNERHETFAVGPNPSLVLRLATGDIRVLPGADGTVEVIIRGRQPEAVVVEQTGDTIAVRQEPGRWTGGSLDLAIRAPHGINLEAALASADLRVEVDVGDAQMSVASGDLRSRRVTGDAVVKSASGDVEIDEIGGRLRVTSASGDVTIGVVDGDAVCSTASGDIVVGCAEADLAAKSASGDVTVDRYRGKDLRGKTVSGDMTVGLARGRRADVNLQSLTGDLRLPANPTPTDDADRPPVRIFFKSVSGDFELVESPSP